jgi:hypothetical protein
MPPPKHPPHPPPPLLAPAPVAPIVRCRFPPRSAVIAFQRRGGFKPTKVSATLPTCRRKFEPKQAQLKTLNDEIENLKKQLQAQGDKLSPAEAAGRRTKKIDEKTKQLAALRGRRPQRLSDGDGRHAQHPGLQGIRGCWNPMPRTRATRWLWILGQPAAEPGGSLGGRVTPTSPRRSSTLQRQVRRAGPSAPGSVRSPASHQGRSQRSRCSKELAATGIPRIGNSPESLGGCCFLRLPCAPGEGDSRTNSRDYPLSHSGHRR